MYNNLIDNIDIASLPVSLFSTPVKLSNSHIKFPFITSINNFAFKCWDEGNHFTNFISSSLFRLDGGNHFMNFLSPSVLYLIKHEVREINLYIIKYTRDDIHLYFSNRGLLTHFDYSELILFWLSKHLHLLGSFFMGNIYFPGTFLERI